MIFALPKTCIHISSSSNLISWALITYIYNIKQMQHNLYKKHINNNNNQANKKKIHHINNNASILKEW